MNSQPSYPSPAAPDLESAGYCRNCGRMHRLGPGNSPGLGLELMRLLADRGTIDLFSSHSSPDPALSTGWLFGPARGKMFGLLECLRPDGSITVLRAFSGQYNGRWLVEGWVEPLFDVDAFDALRIEAENRIKELGRKIETGIPHSDSWLALRQRRRLLSRQLMQDIHGLYRLTNFRGERASLAEAFLGDGGIPTGTGDCCGPKLLNHAAKNRLRPIGLTEFYWGRDTRSASRLHSSFNSSCAEKCRPILGFMLCGLDDDIEREPK